MKVRSVKGKIVNIGALREQSGNNIALGNTRMNARGDIIGRNGQIEATKEQIVTAYYANNPKAVTVSKVSLADISSEILTPAQAVEQLQKEAPKRRRIKDSEE